jgi:DNA polymerase
VLNAFRHGRDLYSEFAAATFGKQVRKPVAADLPDVAREMEAYRQVGKQAVLGLGFSMGALKFMNRLRAEPTIAALFDRGDLTPLVCRDIVDRYRRQYPRIPKLWKDLESGASRAAAGCEVSLKKLRFDRSGDTVRLWLPSGRALRYPRLRTEKQCRTISYLNADGQQAEFSPAGTGLVYGQDTDLYGGKLCENVVQAVARDLLGEAILRLEEAGLPVVFHVHDEVVVEVPDRLGEVSRDQVAKLLNITPAWAEGLPISSEVKISPRYAK